MRKCFLTSCEPRKFHLAKMHSKGCAAIHAARRQTIISVTSGYFSLAFFTGVSNISRSLLKSIHVSSLLLQRVENREPLTFPAPGAFALCEIATARKMYPDLQGGKEKAARNGAALRLSTFFCISTKMGLY